MSSHTAQQTPGRTGSEKERERYWCMLTDVSIRRRRRIGLAPHHLARRALHVYDARIPEAQERAGLLVLGEAVDLQPVVLPVRVALDVVRTLDPGRVQGDGVAGLGGDASLARQEGHVDEGPAGGGEDAGLAGCSDWDLG